MRRAGLPEARQRGYQAEVATLERLRAQLAGTPRARTIEQALAFVREVARRDAVCAGKKKTPLLVKLAPDLMDEGLRRIVTLCTAARPEDRPTAAAVARLAVEEQARAAAAGTSAAITS